MRSINAQFPLLSDCLRATPSHPLSYDTSTHLWSTLNETNNIAQIVSDVHIESTCQIPRLYNPRIVQTSINRYISIINLIENETTNELWNLHKEKIMTTIFKRHIRTKNSEKNSQMLFLCLSNTHFIGSSGRKKTSQKPAKTLSCFFSRKLPQKWR